MAHLEHSLVWSWAFRKVDYKYMEISEIEKISWTNDLRKEEVLQGSRGRGMSYKQRNERRQTGLVKYCVGTAF